MEGIERSCWTKSTPSDMAGEADLRRKHSPAKMWMTIWGEGRIWMGLGKQLEGQNQLRTGSGALPSFKSDLFSACR